MAEAAGSTPRLTWREAEKIGGRPDDDQRPKFAAHHPAARVLTVGSLTEASQSRRPLIGRHLASNTINHISTDILNSDVMRSMTPEMATSIAIRGRGFTYLAARSSNIPKSNVDAYIAIARSRGIVPAHLRMSNAAF